jgi:molecular chaperone Hsp33
MFPAAMLNDPAKESESSPVEVRCYFVRKRNALLTRARFDTLFMDYYLHLMQHQLRHEPERDALLKDGLAALTLHLASRPWGEAAAWTVNFLSPLMNLFVTGSNRLGNVTGRIFTEDVKKGDRNLFFSQITDRGNPLRQSTVEFGEVDLFHAVETYYRQSEQRPARYFRFAEEDLVMVTAQPDCDMPWFLTLDDEAIRSLDQTEELSLLETREYRFDCGCSIDRIYPILGKLSEELRDELFDDEDRAVAQCPRCGAQFSISRQGYEAFLASDE